MINRRTNIRRLIWALAGSAFASLLAFSASPISIFLLGDVKFSQLSIWIIYVTFVQILDFGFSQQTLKQCSNITQIENKKDLINKNNKFYIYLIVLLLPISIIIPKPNYHIYNTIDEFEWLLFKISVILNVKLLYNQNAIIALNNEKYFTFFQILMALSRFIVPIIVYFISNSFLIVILYLIISTIILIILSDKYLDIKWKSLFNLSDGLYIIKSNIKSSLIFYVSGFSAVLLSVIDRILASYILDTSNFAKYSLTFTLASVINIIVLPFYRFFIGIIRSSNRVYNQRNALRISVIQSYACLLVGGFICLYSNEIMQMFGLNFSIDIELLYVFVLSLWGVANGWIIASEIMLRSRPAIQGKQIGFAIAAYFAYLVIQGSPQPIDLALIWVFHGIIQTFICPFWMSSRFSIPRYLLWLNNVVFKPSLIVGSLIAISYYMAHHSMLYSILIFGLGALLLSVAIISKGNIEKIV